MTLKEAKNKLKKEGFVLNKLAHRLIPEEAFTEYEDPDVCEAMYIIESAGFSIGMELNHFDERKARLKKEREKHSNAPMPAPGSAENRIKEDSGVNPALKESSSQFNDALLDEQAKKIDELIKENEDLKSYNESLDKLICLSNITLRDERKRLGKKISRLNKSIHKKNMKIEELRKESSEHLRGKIQVFYENVDLEGKLKDKDAVLSDVAEELRLSKIREKNLTELCQKYMKENEKLKKELADKVVDKIDAQALKSAESALAEKDEVIADLGKELAATKKELEEKIKLVETVRNASKQYCEYGIAAEKMIQKMANVIVYGKPVSSEDFKEYRRWANGYRYNPQLSDFIEEEEKKLSSGRDNHPTEDNPEEVTMDEILEHVRKALEEGGTVSISYDKAEEGGDQSATIVQHGKSIVGLFNKIKRLWL